MSSTGQPDPAAAPATSCRKTLIRAGWVIDGQGSAPLADQWITIEQGRITSVAPALKNSPPPAGSLDFTRATLLPALMDAHVHLSLSGTLDAAFRTAQLEFNPQQAKQLIAQHLADQRRCGIGAVRDAGDRQGIVITLKQNSQAIHVAATCWAWHRAGRYGSMIGRPLDSQMIRSNQLSEHLTGADHIKLIHSGLNSIDHFGQQTPPQFTADQLNAVAKVARQTQLPIMVHANGETPVAMAIAAGCRSIEHGYFMGRENIKRMADRQIFWVPTAIPMAALTRHNIVTAPQADVARQTLDHQLEQIAFAHRRGVPIALGTDAGAIGVDHGTAVAEEMDLLLKSGMPIGQVIRTASLNNARLMGLKNRGALCKGRRADLIAVAGPPGNLPKSLRRIEGIWMNGQRI